MFIKDLTVVKVPSLKEFTTNANGLENQVTVIKGEYQVVANSILGLLALGLRAGDKVTLKSDDESSLTKMAGLLT